MGTVFVWVGVWVWWVLILPVSFHTNSEGGEHREMTGDGGRQENRDHEDETTLR
jgi:hypothetical protein